MHETKWKPETAGKATSASHPAAEKEEESAGSIPEIGMFREFSLPLVERISEERLQSLETETGVRETAQIKPTAETGIDTDTTERGDELRIYDRPLDSTPGDGGNRETLWHILSYEPPMAIPDRTWLELSEAGKEGDRAGRSGDCVLEKHHVAEYKKKPENSKPIWCSSTKVDSCSFLTCSEHGHRGERLLSCGVPTNGIRFRLSRLSVSPRTENESLFMPVFTPTKTSNRLRLLNFSSTCSNNCVVPWYCSGTAVPRIKEPQSENLSASIHGCLVTASLAMPRNSIPMNSSGIPLSMPCPIVLQETCAILKSSYIPHYRECGNLRKCSGLASMLLSCHGVNNVSITYA